MSDILADFWSELFDKMGIFGLLIASAVPVILLLIAFFVLCLIVGLIKALFGRRKTHGDPGKSHQAAEESAEKIYRDAEALAEESLDKLPEAFDLYLKSAKMGYFAAQGTVGRMYYYGSGTKRNKEEGLFWLKKSAEQGGVYARILLGRIYDEDKRFEDPGEVLDWLIPVAEDGDDEAQYLLSRMYAMKQEHREKILGYAPGQWKEDKQCLQWYDQSKHWLELAAKNGNEKAEDLYW